MIEFLKNIDYAVFQWINSINSPFFDEFFFYVSGKFIWVPFYLLLLFLIIVDYRRKSLIIIAFIPILVLLTDQISVQCFKDVFHRLRPCHDPVLEGLVHTVRDKCGGSYGFVSSHAANTFGLAVFLIPFFSEKRKYMIWILLIPFAGLISYSRVYLGVHFPGDVLVGGLLGALIGYGLSRFVLWVLQSRLINNRKFFR